MEKLVVLVFAATFLHVSSGDVNVSDYIYWKKADIQAWHEFFPSRLLQQELTTLRAAVDAEQLLYTGLNDSLSSVVAFQARELSTAQLLMQHTLAAGCVSGIADFMPNAIAQELDTYEDCAADALAKLQRLNVTWARTRDAYFAAYQRALLGIDVCARTYPNKESIARLVSCVESMNTNYFAAAAAVQSALVPSPAMSYYQTTVVQCNSNAANNVASKGWKFLGMLVECARLTSTIDPDDYAAELNKWQGYNDTLRDQIFTAQTENKVQVEEVEEEMQEYYYLQKQALEQYVIQSRGLAFYLNKTYVLLSDYYNTVTATALDNPGDLGCSDTAKAALDAVASDGASQSLTCDVSIVNSTKTLIADVVEDFLYLNSLMPSIGNVALLQCFSQGYIFAPNTILDCFDLVYSSFDVEHSDRRVNIQAKYTVLQNYVLSFFSGNDLPCGGSSLRRLLLAADAILYELQRCLYIGSGTPYAVTTPSYSTITSTSAYTTS